MSPLAIVSLVLISSGGLGLAYLLSPWCHLNGKGESAGATGILLALLCGVFILLGGGILAVAGLVSLLSA
jgi:hypothetical protein